MRLPPVFAIFCLAVGIGPSFALPTSFTRDEYSKSKDGGPPEKQKQPRHLRDTLRNFRTKKDPVQESLYGRVGILPPGVTIGKSRGVHDD
ncbi:hypothetical protein F5148DRAFT_1220024 [Russula earlei]|uniref:Uncharacterized protein n=1 Tax=Russula earlei TaxID=71964 RepID=A0ACC0U2Z9_9AGAM|nr:hypothetical protein F5148DRAFT_1220024 [Russula earlei]